MTGEQIDERMSSSRAPHVDEPVHPHPAHRRALRMWMDILQNRVSEDKLRREKDGIVMGLRNRNRNITTVATRTFQRWSTATSRRLLPRPRGHHDGITRDDLAAWHRKYWGANNFILVVAGDFRRAEMLQRLEATFGKWRAAEKAEPKYPEVQQAVKGGVYMVQPQGATPNQGIIRSATSV